MRAFTKIAGALLLALSPMGASAATFSNFVAIYDDALKLFEFRGTVETTTLSQFDVIQFEIAAPFDFIGTDNPTFRGATYPISSIGGDFSVSGAGSIFRISDFNGSPAGAPFDFSFFVSTPNGSNRFIEASTEVVLGDLSGLSQILDITDDPFTVL